MAGNSWWGEELVCRADDDALWARGARAVTYGRMRSEVEWLRRVYRHHGVGVRSTVALHGTPSFTQLWSVFALWSLGAHVVLLPQRVDLAAALADAGPQFHVSFGGSDRAHRAFADECEVMVRRRPGGRPADDESCLVQFSSGTTGDGRLVGRTAESLLAELTRMAAVDGMPAAGENLLLLDSTTHSFGFVGGLLHSMNAGAVVLFPPAKADADVVFGGPDHFDALARDPARRAPRVAVSSGEVLPHGVFERFHDRYGVRIGQAYGTTETGLLAADPRGAHGPDSVGVRLPGLRTRVERGVLEVHLARSPYRHAPEPWLGGWLSTHDLVTVAPATGALRLRGRVDGCCREHDDVDLLAVERALQAHPGVREAVVVCSGVVEALVTGSPALDEAGLVSWLSGARVPVRCHVVPELPRTADGKFVRGRKLMRVARGVTP